MRKLSVLVLVTATFVGCERASRICEGRVVGSNEVVQVDVDRVVKDALRRMDEGLPSSPLYGGIEVDTTIDRRLQRKLTEILCRNADTNDTGVGVGVILRVEDGAVLAMADCGEDSDGIPLAVGRSYELGSVMMPLTAAIAVEKDIVRMDTLISTKRDDERYYKLPGDGCHVWPDSMSLCDAIVRSSCVVIGKVGYDLGQEQMSEGLSAFGIGRMTKIGYVGENGGILCRKRWDRASRSRIPIGQGVAMTLMQVVRAYAILAHGGAYVEPYVVSSLGKQGKVIYRHSQCELRQVVSKDTADQVLAALKKTAEEGTARRVAMAGVPVAGKTGTMQRVDIDACCYLPGRYRATFCGCFPASLPRYVVAVMFETKHIDAEFKHQGGQRPVAAFSEIVSYMARSAQKDGL